MTVGFRAQTTRAAGRRLGAGLNVALLVAVALALAVVPGSGLLPESEAPASSASDPVLRPVEIDPTDVQTVAALTPTPVYTEDFENGMTQTANGAKSLVAGTGVGTPYSGAGGQTFTGSPNWTLGNYCNGVVLSANNSSAPGWATGESKCRAGALVQSWNGIRTLARGMGQYTNNSTADNEHIVSTYTECANGTCNTINAGATNGILFDTVNDIPVTANRYYTFSVTSWSRTSPRPWRSPSRPLW